ncbi:MAG: hypothetical protein ACI8UD_003409 [Planctomycetota bacterium]|jgi:hypothetical protein
MMTRHQLPAAFTFLMCATAATALGTLLPGAQTPTPQTPSTQDAKKSTEPNGLPNQMALALRVEKAHGGASKKISAFRSKIELELTDRARAQGALVGLDVTFLEIQEPKREQLTTLLRYEIRKAEEPIVRGQDTFGPWHIDKGESRDLTGAGTERDLQAFMEHKNLAKQLVRFLKPADVIRSLSNCSEVAEHELKWTRAKTLQTLKIHGNIEKFPMMRNAGEEAPARLTLYVDKKTDRVIAVDVTPIIDGEPQSKQGERITLQKFRARNGLNVPHKLSYLWRDKNGSLRSHAKVNILQLDLEPGLKQTDLDRQ